MRRRLITGAVVAGGAALLVASPAGAQEVSSEPTTQAILDNLWVMIAGILVLFMQAGFALVEAGLTRGKNVANIMMKNLMDLCAGVLAFYVIGYSIAYGESGNSFIGWGNWFLDFASPTEFGAAPSADHLTIGTNFFFQVAFAATAATIVSGAMAERTKFKSYFIYSFVITALIYPIVVHWTWGGGWLAQREFPFSDFAGSTIVHSVGGWAALMGALILGPRLGKYTKDGKPRAILGHSIPLVMLGTVILFVGWFGFNPGSELAADLFVMDIAVITLLSAAAGGLTAMLTIWLKSGKPDVGMTCNGVLAGLVSITAGCGAFYNWAGIVVGAIGGILVVFSVEFFEKVVKVDDPVGAISVHGVCGAWGTLAIGIFAAKDDAFLGREDAGLIYGGGFDQLLTQIIMVGAVFLFVTITAGALFMAIKATVGLRVTPEEEIEGLDVLEHGSPGYAGDSLAGFSLDDLVTAGPSTSTKSEV
ncbi:ammonium transporter [Iamia majanohamensis]|uniref:Ammonium transporter n=1 Tax=Iamia majanohamensis TaxID=467976 RepID=A0AAF0BVZ4_9ACTN|nr:ammonium transporter [Iamia majanohamensis]WCO67270.1 ammonium transporter [Iamia majanohamensis]